MPTTKRTIQDRIDEPPKPPALPNGEPVNAMRHPLRPNTAWGGGIRQSAGAWAEVENVDAVIDLMAAERTRECGPG